MRYIVISPVRNEAKHVSRTIESMLRQTTPPVKWIVVDDGSKDGTRELVEAAAKRASWIQLVVRKDRGFRKAGAGVVEAFYEGFEQVGSLPWDIVVKMDGDLEFEPTYFETLLKTFENEPTLGIGGGDIYHHKESEVVIESSNDPAFHVRGANKAYRFQCWQQMNGLFRVTGWDTLDEVKANMLGWKTRRIESLRMLHLKPTGAADGKWKDSVKNGRGSYISGYHPLFLCARSLRRIFSWPPLVETTGLLWGFASGYFGKAEQIEDKALIKYLRKQQLNKLLLQPSIW